MKLTVIKDDSLIYIDGVPATNCDLTGTNVFHAIQFDTDNGGHVEFQNPARVVEVTTSDEIQDLTGKSVSEYQTIYNNSDILNDE